MKVLIAVDGSKGSDVALQEALERPWLPGTHFCLITVVDPFFFTHAPALFEDTEEAANEFLMQAAKKFEAAGWLTDVNVILGNPRRVISKYAEDWLADLLLVGSHGLNALERLALGSTVRAVLRHAKCSVEVVRKAKTEAVPGKRGKRILIATDGSEFSTAAVKAMAECPWPGETEIKVLSVPEFALWLGEYPYMQRVQVEELNQSALDAARAAVAEAKEMLRRTKAQVITDVPIEREGVAKTILQKAKEWGADLIVVGSHGRRGFDRWAMGSVSESLAINAHCAVEVVRPPFSKELRENEREVHESERDHDVHAVYVP